MKKFLVSTKSIIGIVLFFVFILVVKLAFTYIENNQKMEDFALRQATTLNDFMITHRAYYQKLYLNKTIPLDENTLKGLPAFSSLEISEQFSKINHFNITIKTVSDNPRNKKNSADTSELESIDSFRTTNQKYYFKDKGEYFQFATPLYIKEGCLQCHGDKKDAPKFIQNQYTQAYGYKVGELRGVVSIKIPKKNLEEYFTTSFFKSLVFDFIILFAIFGISLYFIKYFRSLSVTLKNEIDETTKELQETVALLNSHQIALEKSSIVSKSDLKGRITYANENFYTISGFTKNEVLGKTHSILRHPNTPKELFQEMWNTIQEKKVWNGILQNRGKKGDYWIDSTVVPILDKNGNIKEYMAVRHDITKIMEHQENLERLANSDTLTGFGNRNKLNVDIQKSINPALAIINIDQFSILNDFYGHTIGDTILKEFGKTIELLDENNFFQMYRLQGDEFILFHGDISKDIFLKELEVLIEKLSNIAFEIEAEKIYINFTVALSFEEKDTILQTADMAFKLAKLQNKDMVIYSDELSLTHIYESNILWSKKIKSALENGNIVPFFQPIVNNTNQKFEKYESLVRLIDEDRKTISPYFFLDISKKTKQYLYITKVMIEKSFEYFKEKECEFSINLTMEDILNETLVQHIFTLLDSYKIGHRVVFEIVESESIQNYEVISEFIIKLKSFGCKIAIDDFGSGYSNFEYLLKLNVDFIKLDGSLIKNITKDTNSQIIVSTIVNFAKQLGIKTIAEFVENEEIFLYVKDLGVDYSQGYYFDAPKKEI